MHSCIKTKIKMGEMRHFLLLKFCIMRVQKASAPTVNTRCVSVYPQESDWNNALHLLIECQLCLEQRGRGSRAQAHFCQDVYFKYICYFSTGGLKLNQVCAKCRWGLYIGKVINKDKTVMESDRLAINEEQ